MKSLRVTVALLFGLLGAVPALGQDALGSYRFELDGQSFRIPSIRARVDKRTTGPELVSLRGLGAAIGAAVKPSEDNSSFGLGIAGVVVRFPVAEPTSVLVNDRVVTLSAGARRIGSDLYVSTDFLKRVVIPLLHGNAVGSDSDGLRTVVSGPQKVSMLTAGASSSAAAAGAAPLRASRTTPDPSSNLVVVLDPGHGGTETGAAGKDGTLEKEITLDIARRLKTILTGQSGLTVLLTRDADEVMGLDDRTALANQNHADLFVSIHVNAAPRRDAHGAETYFLALKAKDEEVRTLAAMENNAAGVDRERMGDVPEGLELILWDMAQSQYLEGSSRLAESIQNQMNDALGVKDRGVKQAPFRVLMGATMPAVLVEVGFISNPDEEDSLKTEDYRDKIAQALSRAIDAYIPEAKKRFTNPSQRVR